MLNIDEAILHYEEVAESEERKARLHQRPDKGIKGSGKRYLSCIECASENRQLAEWLRELKDYKNKDMRLIYANPLGEAIRCAMCTNPIKSDRGCDGGCKVDEQMYKKVMEAVNGLIVEVNADGEGSESE